MGTFSWPVTVRRRLALTLFLLCHAFYPRFGFTVVVAIPRTTLGSASRYSSAVSPPRIEFSSSSVKGTFGIKSWGVWSPKASVC